MTKKKGSCHVMVYILGNEGIIAYGETNERTRMFNVAHQQNTDENYYDLCLVILNLRFGSSKERSRRHPFWWRNVA